MTHTAELIAVGTELLLGNIANTDAQMLSKGLSALGINVYYHTVVGDNPQRLKAAVEVAKSRADIIITTGGLGPTCDDLTKNVLAECFGKKLVYDEESAERIRDYFQRLHPGGTMTENNLQQAMLPEGCTVFTPRHPRLRPLPGEIEAAEANLDIEALVDEAVKNIERIQVNP